MSFFHDAKAAKDTATTIRILALNYDQSRTNLNHDLVQTEGCVRITVVSGLPRSGTSLMMHDCGRRDFCADGWAANRRRE